MTLIKISEVEEMRPEKFAGAEQTRDWMTAKCKGEQNVKRAKPNDDNFRT
jgi:hypothetical protein